MENNLELYKVFYTVSKCGNISQAADQLFISQPAVSKSIKKLEDIVGFTLFSRNSRGVKLTEEGIVLLEYVERAFNELSVGEKILTKLKTMEQGTIRIGVSTILCKHFFIPALRRFMVDFPHIEFKIVNKSTAETLKLVEQGELDLSIVSEFGDNVKGDNLTFRKLAEIQDIFVASRDFVENNGLSSELLPFHGSSSEPIPTNATFMLLEKENISRQYIDKYLRSNNLVVKPEFEMSSMDLLVEFAKIGVGITAAVKEFIQADLENGSLVQLEIMPKIPKRNIGVVHHKNIPLSIAAREFIHYL